MPAMRRQSMCAEGLSPLGETFVALDNVHFFLVVTEMSSFKAALVKKSR
jgi:hypothetical protein